MAEGRRLRVVVLGGCGFIGRNLVEHLVVEGVASHVRVVDKVPPQLAWLSPRHAEAFRHPSVSFRSANLISAASAAAALEPDPGAPWDLVVNCAGETKPAQSDAVYKEGVYTVGLNCAKECARLGRSAVARYVEVSSGCVCGADGEPHREDGPVRPWTAEARWKVALENDLRALEDDLDVTVVRPAVVYGVGDRRGLTRRLIVAAVYGHLGEVMKLMWNADLKLNTIAAADLCRAIVFLARTPEAAGQTYNAVDRGGTTQGDVAAAASALFGVRHDFWGSTLSRIAKADLDSVLEDVNDKHLAGWASACAAGGVRNTPLDPTATAELLLDAHVNLDGSKLERLGFRPEVERLSRDALREVIRDFEELGIFPRNLLRP